MSETKPAMTDRSTPKPEPNLIRRMLEKYVPVDWPKGATPAGEAGPLNMRDECQKMISLLSAENSSLRAQLEAAQQWLTDRIAECEAERMRLYAEGLSKRESWRDSEVEIRRARKLTECESRLSAFRETLERLRSGK